MKFTRGLLVGLSLEIAEHQGHPVMLRQAVYLFTEHRDVREVGGIEAVLRFEAGPAAFSGSDLA